MHHDFVLPERERILGVPVDVIDMETTLAGIVAAVEDHREGARAWNAPHLIVTLNPEMVIRAQTDDAFRGILERASVVIPDGIGVVNALQKRGHPESVRVTGADLVTAYLPIAALHEHRVAFVGAGPGIAGRAAKRARELVPGLFIVAADSGHPTQETAERLAKCSPEVVFAAYGAGKQEEFLDRFLPLMDAPVGVGIGGTFDYLAGVVHRAPQVVQRIGGEWAWRLLLQPWRITRQRVLPEFYLRERRERRVR